MSLENDFMQLITQLWKNEQFNVWYLQEHSSLAYLLDRSFRTSDYQKKYNDWLFLARTGDIVLFAWNVLNSLLVVCEEDERIDSEELLNIKKYFSWKQKEYERKTLFQFGVIRDKYVPKWFYDSFEDLISSERFKRAQLVMGNLESDYTMSTQRRQQAYQKISAYPDILNEFYHYVRKKEFATKSPIEIEGFTAKKLFESTYLSPLGAYNYLIYLRESPEQALSALKKGLPRKNLT